MTAYTPQDIINLLRLFQAEADLRLSKVDTIQDAFDGAVLIGESKGLTAAIHITINHLNMESTPA